MGIDLICLDADDTLWHNMRHFDAAERALFAMLEPFATPSAARERLQRVGARNLAIYGYGAKSFTLSNCCPRWRQHLTRSQIVHGWSSSRRAT